MSNTSDSDPAAAAAAAAIEAFHKFTIELWTLYSIGVAITCLRTYARVKGGAGFRNLRADDYLVWVGIMFYTIQSSLAYSIGNVANGLANNSMTDAERAALSPSDPEYRFRVIGSKIQVAGWSTYSALIWSLKLSMLAFYIRLTEGLGRVYRVRIYIGFFLVISTFFASILTVFISCRPFNKYWQINPDPGNVCQAAISRPIIWVSFASNVATDIYLIFIPLPMLWSSSLRLIKKIASTIILGAGVFVLVCAILKSVFVLVDPVNGPQLAGAWGTRETFVAVVTTNLPSVFPLFRMWLAPFFGSLMNSSQKNSYQNPSAGFRTIGGGGGGGASYSRGRGPPSANPITANMTFNDSDERMVDEVKMQTIKSSESPTFLGHPTNGIVVSNEVEVTHEDRRSQHSDQPVHKIHETW